MTNANVVGYKKPPAANRFKKGRSGNPRGRPKGSRNAAGELNGILNSKVTVRDKNGNATRTTYLRAILQQLVLRGARGEHSAIRMLLQFLLSNGAFEPANDRPSGVIIAPATILDPREWFETHVGRGPAGYKDMHKLQNKLKQGQ